MDVTKMEAGPELDALVAEKVLGWRWIKYPWYDGTTQQLLWPDDADEPPRGDDFKRLADGRLVPWNLGFSSGIVYAWEALGVLKTRAETTKKFFCYRHEWSSTRGHWVQIQYGASIVISVTQIDTLPLAICYATLQVAEALNAG